MAQNSPHWPPLSPQAEGNHCDGRLTPCHQNGAAVVECKLERDTILLAAFFPTMLNLGSAGVNLAWTSHALVCSVLHPHPVCWPSLGVYYCISSSYLISSLRHHRMWRSPGWWILTQEFSSYPILLSTGKHTDLKLPQLSITAAKMVWWHHSSALRTLSYQLVLGTLQKDCTSITSRVTDKATLEDYVKGRLEWLRTKPEERHRAITGKELSSGEKRRVSWADRFPPSCWIQLSDCSPQNHQGEWEVTHCLSPGKGDMEKAPASAVRA